jgi:hypothetical protein
MTDRRAAWGSEDESGEVPPQVAEREWRRKRLHARLGLLAVCLMLWAGVVLFRRGAGWPISWDAYARVQNGMTEAEVKKLLGEPDRVFAPVGAPGYYSWDGSNGTAIVFFDNGWRVRSKGHEKDTNRWLLRLFRKAVVRF